MLRMKEFFWQSVVKQYLRVSTYSCDDDKNYYLEMNRLVLRKFGKCWQFISNPTIFIDRSQIMCHLFNNIDTSFFH